MKDVQILLRQHVGAPCQATVKSGDKVKKGTLIAENRQNWSKYFFKCLR